MMMKHQRYVQTFKDLKSADSLFCITLPRSWNINDQTTLPPSLPIRKNQPSCINYNMCLAKGIIIYEVLHKLQIIKVHFYD